MLKYDEIVTSSENYFEEDLPGNQCLMFPAINPLSEKNKGISEKTIYEHISRGPFSKNWEKRYCSYLAIWYNCTILLKNDSRLQFVFVIGG
jgi:hypothetical protein